MALAMAVFWIPRDAPTEAVRRAREVASRIDVAGIAGFAGAITGLLIFLLSLPHPNWAALAVAIGVGAALVVWELRAATPFIDVRLLVSNAALTRTYIRMGLTSLGIYSVLYGITQWIEVGRGFTSEEAGLLMLRLTAVSVVVIRPISARNLVRGPLITTGVSLVVAAMGVMLLTTHSPVVLIVGVTVIFGIALGTGTAGNQTALYSQASPEQVGTAAGLFRTFNYLGSNRLVGHHRHRLPNQRHRPRPSHHRPRRRRRGSARHDPPRPASEDAAPRDPRRTRETPDGQPGSDLRAGLTGLPRSDPAPTSQPPTLRKSHPVTTLDPKPGLAVRAGFSILGSLPIRAT